METLLRICGEEHILAEEDRAEALPYLLRKDSGKIACCCEAEEVVVCEDDGEALLLWLVLFYVFNFKTTKRNCNTNWVMRRAVFQLPVEKKPCQPSLKELATLVNLEEGM